MVKQLSSAQIAQHARDAQLDRIEGMLAQVVNTAQVADYRKAMEQNVIQLLALMADGRKIEAIKLLRQITWLPLKEAKDYVCNAIQGS